MHVFREPNRGRESATLQCLIRLFDFPFPCGLTPEIPAARYADDPRALGLRRRQHSWTSSRELAQPVRPGRATARGRARLSRPLLPKDEEAAKELKKRTLTNLYNARPQWLAHAHAALDEAVAEAYGWGEDWRAGLLS